MPLIVPTYLRLVDLLIGQERTIEALQLIEQFEKRYRDRRPRPYAPTDKQITLMKIKKSSLKKPARPTEALPAA